MLQIEALNLIKMGKNVFLTGEAGSGKTYLLNQIIQHLREHQVKVAVTASTGIAATHLNGSTLHAWSGIGIKDSLTDADLDKLLTSDRLKRNYKKTRVLIIDEISMLHAHQLNMVDQIARRMLCPDQSFGGLQVILCGDFFQLPPVSSRQFPDENKLFAFESSAWEQGDFHVCYLHEQHRQGDDPLYRVLHDIRNATTGEHTKIPLRTRYKKEPASGIKATKLYSRNINVEAINNNQLELLEGKSEIFTMETHGFPALVEGLMRNCLAQETLQLKIGAQVMFIKNDLKGSYSNGTRGVVTAFEDSDEAWPIVTTFDKRIITVRPESWNYEDNDIIRATLTQIPLRLAWAITIHKSQGMTLDSAEIDLGDAFEPGMGYVALSRVRRLDGIKLMNLNEMALRVSDKVLEQDRLFKQGSHESEAILKDLSPDHIKSIQKETLLVRLGGCEQMTAIKHPKRTPKSKKIQSHLVTLEMFRSNPSIEAIAAERDITKGTVYAHLEKLRGLQLITQAELSHLRSAIPDNVFDLICSAFKKSQEGHVAPVYNHFNGEYSYELIRLVRLFVI
jgi:ATP-dependent DNA helicase PIF1